MKTLLLLLLAALTAAAAWVLYSVPVHRYVIDCVRHDRITCAFERITSSGTERRTGSIAHASTARVVVQPVRRGSPRVLLYIREPDAKTERFVAEFEGAGATDRAAAAAAQLNAWFQGAATATRVTAEAPSYYRWLSWGGIAVTALLLMAGARSRHQL